MPVVKRDKTWFKDGGRVKKVRKKRTTVVKPSGPKKPKTLYPWDQWFTDLGRGPIVLTRKKEYEGTTPGMIYMLRAQSAKRKVRLKIEHDEDAGTLTVTLKS